MSLRAAEFVRPVEEFVGQAFARCGDVYGEKQTPLLADGIRLDSGEPIRWEGSPLSNLACQQNFLRALDGLAALTGKREWRDKAEGWIACALRALRDPDSDLLYWGGHSNWDLAADGPLKGNHEMKCVYPHYALLHQVNPEATSGFVAAFWQKHLCDRETLLFNRHGEYRAWDRKEAWSGTFKGGPLPIVDNQTLSFINTGSDLIFAAAELHRLEGRDEPLAWALNLLSRYDQIRHPETGLGGYQFNHQEPCRVRESFKGELGQRKEVNETTVITAGTIRVRYGLAAIAFMNAAEALGAKVGRPFLEFVARDLETLAEYSYDETSRAFCSVLNNGEKLSPGDAMDGVGYCSPKGLRPVPANGLMFLAYARAFRLTEEEKFRAMACELAEGMGWGDLSQPVGFDEARDPWQRAGQEDACGLMGLLDLYAASGAEALMASAIALGRRVLSDCVVDAFFVEPEQEGFTRLDSPLPLALLHLAAACEGEQEDLPAFYANNVYWDPKIVRRYRQR